MAKKKKHPKLPNGFGSIKKLSGNRVNPYAVYPPTTEYDDETGVMKQPTKALCYVSDWYIGFYALMDYKNGVFDPDKIASLKIENSANYDDVISKIIASYNAQTFSSSKKETFTEVYNQFYAYKFERETSKKLSRQSRDAAKSGYRYSSELHNLPFSEITAEQLQKAVDDCPRKHATKELIVNLYKQMYKFAYANHLCDRDISGNLTINTPDDDEQGVPFTPEQIKILWENKDKPFVDTILIYCYSGFRLNELAETPLSCIDLENRTFNGGLKNEHSRGRTVPIHSLIYEMVSKRYDPRFKSLIYHDGNKKIGVAKYREYFSLALISCGITEKHTPHDCRHTFSWLCDKAKMDEVSKHMMMGHSLGKDVEKKKYSHRTLDELKEEMEKITFELL